MLKQAKDKAERMIQDAEKHSAQIRASLIRDMEKVIAAL
jgi:vacuolar-type H+-ATPase subunit H